jgi:glycosyltransferase involved in cell wall biosynthesis
MDQTYQNWELIIVDDASTDETSDLISHYVNSDHRIRTIRHETNRKLPAALNTGFSLAKGDYFTWTSDDNYYRESALAEMVAYLESEPEVGVVYTDYSRINESGDILEKVVVDNPEGLLVHNCIGNFLYRRKVYQVVGDYSEDLYLAEDYDFWLRVSTQFRFEPLHKDLYFYLMHPNSLSEKYIMEIQKATERTKIKNLPHLNWANKHDIENIYLKMVAQASERNDMKQTRSNLQNAIIFSPTILKKIPVDIVFNSLLGKKVNLFSRFIHLKKAIHAKLKNRFA